MRATQNILLISLFKHNREGYQEVITFLEKHMNIDVDSSEQPSEPSRFFNDPECIQYVVVY